jgi:hypothetical protein
MLNDISERGASSLAAVPISSTVQRFELDLCNNPIGDVGALQLAGFHSAPLLQSVSLMLVNCRIGNFGALTLSIVAATAGLPLHALDLRFNNISAAVRQTVSAISGPSMAVVL